MGGEACLGTPRSVTSPVGRKHLQHPTRVFKFLRPGGGGGCWTMISSLDWRVV
jgi:hypothetical protein